MASDLKIGSFQINLEPYSGFTLKTPLYISHLFLHYFFLAALGYTLITQDIGIYIFFFSILTIAILYQVWILFEPINIVISDSSQGSFTIRSRNLLKRLFHRQTIVPYNEIKQFLIIKGPEITLESPRFIIIAVENDLTNKIFTHTNKKEIAEQILNLLQESLIKSKR